MAHSMNILLKITKITFGVFITNFTIAVLRDSQFLKVVRGNGRAFQAEGLAESCGGVERSEDPRIVFCILHPERMSESSRGSRLCADPRNRIIPIRHREAMPENATITAYLLKQIRFVVLHSVFRQ